MWPRFEVWHCNTSFLFVYTQLSSTGETVFSKAWKTWIYYLKLKKWKACNPLISNDMFVLTYHRSKFNFETLRQPDWLIDCKNPLTVLNSCLTMPNKEVLISKSLTVELYEIIFRFDQVSSEVSPDLLEVVNLCSEKVDEIVEHAGLT